MYRFYLFILFTWAVCDAPAQSDRGNATDEYIGFYQKFLSGQKNSRCAMYPSCSAFGNMVFKDKTFWEAMTLLTDRIMRCSHERHLYDVTYEYGYRSSVDFPYYKDIPENIVYNRHVKPHTDAFKSCRYSDNTLPFINYLINKEEYQNALIEIERATFNKQYADTTLFAKKLLCYRGLNDFEKGIFEYEVELPESMKESEDINMQAALLYYVTSNYDNASSVLDRIITKQADTDICEKAYLLKGIIHVQEKQYPNAEKMFRDASTLTANEERCENNLNILKDIKKQKKKSPALARILSVVPGGGYLYTNHKGSALTAFIINSLLGYATYTSIKSKNYGAAGICGFLGLSFYIGNINGAGRSAIRYNEKRRNAYIRRLENSNNIFIN